MLSVSLARPYHAMSRLPRLVPSHVVRLSTAAEAASQETSSVAGGAGSGSGLSPLQQYDADVKLKKIRNDEHQRKMLASLNKVYEDLVHYRRDKSKYAEKAAGGRGGRGFLSRLLRSKSSAAAPEFGPKGIYMYGDVGSGKTMLMDMFYKTVPRHLTKRRVHFHAFMQDMHKLIHSLKSGEHAVAGDPVVLASHKIASMYDVLCLDEVAVIDVADAMILRHIWETMYADGMTMFMTSNRHPDELYLNGVQRESFLPAIAEMKERNHIVFLDSPTDYRKLPRPESGTYYFESVQGAAGAEAHAQHWFDFFSKGEPAVLDRDLDIWGRPVPIPISAGDNVMRFTFAELCGEARSAADYLEMCRTFPAAVITDIPMLSLEQRDLIRRFITFLDAAYDSHTNLALTAAKPFDQLFNTKHLQINPETNKVELVGNDEAKIDPTSFAGHEEMFAFARALSRLKQMSSEEWLDFVRDE